MHTKTRGARRRGRLPLGLGLAAAVVASLSIGVPAASATCTPELTTLTLSPATQTHVVGTNATVKAQAKCGSNPLTNTDVWFKVSSGPNFTGATAFHAKTDANGMVSWTYTSTKTGTDKVGAIVHSTWTCCVSVIWTPKVTKPPLQYTGYAYNAAATVTAPLVGTLTLNKVNPIGPVDTPNATNNSNEIANLTGPLLNADVVESGVKTGSGSSTAFAKTAGADLVSLLGVVPALSNVDVLAESSATCAAQTGKTTITSLKIGSTVLVGPGGSLATGVFVPAANTTVLSIAGLKIVLNEQIKTAGKIVVNAIHITLAAPVLGTSADVIVSHAESDIHNC